jgi:hypothetical protein
MIRFVLFLWTVLLVQMPSGTPEKSQAKSPPLEKSSYFAYADYDYIFTIEIVKPGIPLFNFVSLLDRETRMSAKYVRLSLENRKVPAKLFAVEPGDFQQPMIVPSLTIHPRSSFGVRLEGDFGNVTEISGVTVGVENEDFHLVPLTSFDFESLVLKVNRLNLGSPDFKDDWRVLHLEEMGSRSQARR